MGCRRKCVQVESDAAYDSSCCAVTPRSARSRLPQEIRYFLRRATAAIDLRDRFETCVVWGHGCAWAGVASMYVKELLVGLRVSTPSPTRSSELSLSSTCTCLSCAPRAGTPGALRCKVYPSSLTDAQWAVLQPLLPPANNRTSRGGGPEKHDRRGILDAIFYLVRTGSA